MRGKLFELLLLSAPAALLITLALLLGWPTPLALPLSALAGLLPPLLRLAHTRRKQQAQSQRNQAFIQRLIDVIPQPVYIKDEHSRYLMINQAFAAARDKRPEELIGVPSFTLTPDPQMAAFSRNEDAAVLAGQNIKQELSSPDPVTGEARWHLIMKGACQNAEGETVIVGANFDVSPWRRAEKALQQALEREQAQQRETLAYLQRLLDVIPYPVYVKDSQSRYLLVNKAFLADRQRSSAELLGNTGFPAGLSSTEREEILAEDRAVLDGQVVYKEQQRIHTVTGTEVFRIIAKAACTDIQGKPVIVGATFYLTELRQTERTLQEALARETALRERTEAFIQRLVDVIPDPVYVKNASGRYLLVNEAFADYRHMSREFILGPDFPAYGPATPSRLLSLREDHAVLAGKEVLKEERVTRSVSGEEIHRLVRKRRSVYLDGSPVVIGIDHDITQWRIAERELQQMAQEDALTGLANRRHFQNEAERSIDLAQRYQAPLSLLMLDLDHFKQINDRYGHQCGDQVLIEAVRRLRECLRRADLPGRWGGEEFIVLLPHTPLSEAVQVAERLRLALADQPLQINDLELAVTLSAGVAQRHATEDLAGFIARADAALYAAKHAGRNCVKQASAQAQLFAP